MGKRTRNFLGAFSDGAILFPLLSTLSVGSSFSSVTLLASAGIAYLWAAWFFRIPMAVQPLKAVAIAAVVSGASFSEVRFAGGVVGVFCLTLAFVDVLGNLDRYIERIPRVLVHGVQMGLGVLLILKGLELFSSWQIVAIAALLILLGLWIRDSELPVLGLLATGGLLWTVLSEKTMAPHLLAKEVSVHLVRPQVLLALALPQMVLTSANSVIATHDVAHRYFGTRANRVTPKRLLQSIGFGNLISSFVGGLPFCHGAGGLTAHVRGGASDWSSNVIIGVTLLGLAGIQLLGGQVRLNYPPVLLSVLLILVGYYHLKLSAPSWAKKTERVKLIAMLIAALATQNMIWILAAGILIFGLEIVLRSRQFPWRVLP